jgi:hypothetical protein
MGRDWEQVNRARGIQAERFKGKETLTNSAMNPADIL